MKKIFILIFALFIAFGLSLSVFAEESVELAPEGTYDAGETSSPVDETSDSFDTVLTRLYEWWEIRKAEILALAGSFGAVILALLWKKIRKSLTDIIAKILSLINSTDTSTKNINSLIKGYNGQTDKIVSLEAEIIKTREDLSEAKKKLEETEELVGHIAHILTTVYTNSKALPQGVKDMVNIECAQCMKLVDLSEDSSHETET